MQGQGIVLGLGQSGLCVTPQLWLFVSQGLGHNKRPLLPGALGGHVGHRGQQDLLVAQGTAGPAWLPQGEGLRGEESFLCWGGAAPAHSLLCLFLWAGRKGRGLSKDDF